MSDPERDIRAVLDESGPAYDEFSFERPTAGHQGEVFLVTLLVDSDRYEVVVKFQAGDPDFALEPFLHDYVADRTDIPVPRILVYKETPELDVDSYFVTERIRGQNLAESLGELDQETHEAVIEHAGRILGDMHEQLAFEGYGRLILDESGKLIVDEFTWDWQQFFYESVSGSIDAFEGGPFEDLQADAQQHLDETIDIIDGTDSPRLVHDDFRPANMLFATDESEPISAVLDWQFVLAGDPEYHIARTDFLFIDPTFRDEKTRERLRERLYEGYREYREFEAGDAYENRRAVYHFATLLWRMAGFESTFADFSGLAQGRYEARFRRQYDELVKKLP